MVSCVPGRHARSALAGDPASRFADVRWVSETTSTNADAMALARVGASEGVVVVADHQTAGRGRAGRTWSAPPGSSLLCSVLLRPPVEVMDLSTMVVAVAAAEALESVGGFVAHLKWPNDLVWPGDGTADDRKLAGILAEADWPDGTSTGAAQAIVVVGIGINVSWPVDLPDELADIAVACNHISASTVDREELLVAMLRRLDLHYSALVDGDRASVVQAWRARSATLGRRVRVDLGGEEIVGIAADVTDAGHLVVETSKGRREVAVGDVVHLRPD